MYFSKTTNGFYDKEIHGDRIPGDAVEISAEYHLELIEGQSTGMVIYADEKGFPRLQAPSDLTESEVAKFRNKQARAYLAETDWYVIRKAETGVDVPQEVSEKRQSARLSVTE
jgi:hypothetical protein